MGAVCWVSGTTSTAMQGSPSLLPRAAYLKADTEEGGMKDISMKRGILQRSS